MPDIALTLHTDTGDVPPAGDHAIVLIALFLILAGSFAGAGLMWFQGAGIWQIVLGYVAGGWAGLLTGLPVVVLVRSLRSQPDDRNGAPRRGGPPPARSGFPPQTGDFSTNRPEQAISFQTRRRKSRPDLRPGRD